MKFVTLGTKRAHRSTKLDKPSGATRGRFPTATGEPHQIRTYTELRQQIHDDLRAQHPEWVQADGKSPMCDSYEARLMQLLDSLTRKVSTKSIIDAQRLREQGAH